MLYFRTDTVYCQAKMVKFDNLWEKSWTKWTSSPPNRRLMERVGRNCVVKLVRLGVSVSVGEVPSCSRKRIAGDQSDETGPDI